MSPKGSHCMDWPVMFDLGLCFQGGVEFGGFSLENLKLKTWEKFPSTREAENEERP